MDSDGRSPPPRHAPPHIRVNSGSHDPLQMSRTISDSRQARSQQSRQPSSRSLTRPFRPSTGTSMRRPGGTHPLYQSHTMAESSERLLPPSRNRSQRFGGDDDQSPLLSPSQSGFNSRRTSWSSEMSSDSRSYVSPFDGPFEDSRAPSRAGSDEDDGVNTQTVSEKYNIMPTDGLLLFPEDVEKDDWLHNPDPYDRDGKFKCADLCSKRGVVNVGGLILITIGVAFLFIGYPIL